MQAVRVLGRIDTFQDSVRVDAAGQGQLHDVSSACRIAVELINGGFHLFLRRIGGQVHADRLSTDLGAVAVLARDVGDGPRVLAHQDRAESGDDPGLAQSIHALLELGLDSGGGRRPIENPRGPLPGSPHCSSPAYRGCLSVSFLTRARSASTSTFAPEAP